MASSSKSDRTDGTKLKPMELIDLKSQQALIREADQLRDKAEEMRKAKNASAK